MIGIILNNPLTRIIVACITPLILFLIFGPLFMHYARKFLRSEVREATPHTHQAKKNTPTMGGIFIGLCFICSLILWSDLSNYRTIIIISTFLSFGAIGAYDDWQKIKYKRGISEINKLTLEILASLALIFAWYYHAGQDFSTTLQIPFITTYSIDMGIFFIFWAVWVMLCTVNAVNFTDGLDGLVSLILIGNFITCGLIAYYGNLFSTAQSTDIAIICSALVGSLIGFLRYNAYPAKIFMGDTGSLALGATITMILLMMKKELLIPVIGIIFVIEALSTVIQILGFKITGRRILKKAPLHHHYEMIGWPESSITKLFVCIAYCSCFFGLALLLL